MYLSLFAILSLLAATAIFVTLTVHIDIVKIESLIWIVGFFTAVIIMGIGILFSLDAMNYDRKKKHVRFH